MAGQLFDVWGFGWVWVGLGHGSISSPGSELGWISYLVGWVGSMKIDPRTTLRQPQYAPPPASRHLNSHPELSVWTS